MLTTIALAMTLADTTAFKVDTTQTRLVPTQRGDSYCVTRVITRDEMVEAHLMGLDVHKAKGCNLQDAVTRVVTATMPDGTSRTLFIITQQGER
jgi:hypothetical protein